MSYHIIDISTNNVRLSVKDGQFICKSPDGSVGSLPMEDVGAVLVNSFSAQFHSSFIIEAAKKKVAVIVCECFRPISLVLPVQRISDTILTRSQIQASARLKRHMWEATIRAKCMNQYEFVTRMCPEDKYRLQEFRVSMNGDVIFKEGNCARLYWNAFSRALALKKFRRDTQGRGLNGMLNYGYAVLMLRIEQQLLACGLDPLYGMGHVLRERSLPLAYDMMEPFRPVVDELIFDWVRSHMGMEDVFSVSRDFKCQMQKIMEKKFLYPRTRLLTVDKISECVIRSYKRALISGKSTEYEPWIRRNLKWDG